MLVFGGSPHLKSQSSPTEGPLPLQMSTPDLATPLWCEGVQTLRRQSATGLVPLGMLTA